MVHCAVTGLFKQFGLQNSSGTAQSYDFGVEVLNNYTTICCECGIVREQSQVFKLFQVHEVSLRWSYVPVSRKSHGWATSCVN